MKRYFIVAPKDRPALARDRIVTKGIETGIGTETASIRPSRTHPDTTIATLSPETANQLIAEGSELYEDVQFQIFDPGIPRDPQSQFWIKKPGPLLSPAGGNLAEVTTMIRAPQAWSTTKGAGVTVAIIDTGVTKSLKEFGPARRLDLDIPSAAHSNHWTDEVGHGSMCAAIAVGSVADGGKYDGVAPEAKLIAVRTDFSATDLFLIYDELINAKKTGTISGPLVISNSYGLYQCASNSVMQQDHPYLRNILAAIDADITVVFAAGNNHVDVCQHKPEGDTPNTIWSVNSHDRVISVGTVDRNGSNQTIPSKHTNSSRGPGEWADQFKKPDVVSPTFGEVVWKDGYQVMEWWGTSGACPQVAGLAALMLSKNSQLKPAQVADIIRKTAKKLSGPQTCVGAGMIDCEQALAAAIEAIPGA
ncbi:subtilisin family serine protease [Bradyrhizobium sp. USDA 326]|uniref:S8 family peptidase n=1 Tax=Bradyrhizobium sp. USDA 326 TaxID=3377726 RepID=UPI003C75AA58